MTYRDRPVFEWSLDWTASPEGRTDFDQREVAIGFGSEAVFSDQEEVIRGWAGQVWLDDLDAIETFDAFTAALQGRLVGFWFPAPQAAFQIIAGVSPTACDISGEAFAATFGDRPGVFVWLIKDGQAPQGAKVLAAEANGDGTTRVTFEESVTVDATWLAWDLAYVRLADDTEQAEFDSEQRQRRTVQVVELPAEYAQAETGDRPVYLYRIWVGEGDEQVNWYWTSFAWDLEDVAGQTYNARRITHGAIQYDTTGARQGVTLDVDREIDGSPFKLAFPAHGCQSIHVAISRADYSDLTSAQALFQGVVTEVSASGRVLRVKCATWWGAATTSVPAFLFGPRCPYRVFEPSTCRLARVEYEQAVTLSAVDGRLVTVSSPGLTGVAANWFAEGWLEVGTGLAREVRLVLTSGPESGGSVVLTLNAPLRFNVAGAEAALVPGCDGRWTTCDQKYANTLNFGGHRFAMGNLAIKALDIPAAGGAKK